MQRGFLFLFINNIIKNSDEALLTWCHYNDFLKHVEHIQTQWNIEEISRWKNIFKSFLNEWKLLHNPVNLIASNCYALHFEGNLENNRRQLDKSRLFRKEEASDYQKKTTEIQPKNLKVQILDSWF